uniref:C2H2-type domain-containing protein n=1 Tax=Timema poppense TaxID=170557 RepID=A0A7R9DA00_TIMPO|nr:unnamed protein product [Timema poppensis]
MYVAPGERITGPEWGTHTTGGKLALPCKHTMYVTPGERITGLEWGTQPLRGPQYIVENNAPRHFSIYTRLNNRQALCKICGKMVINLKNHFLVHFPEQHICPRCSKTFSRLDSLTLHIRKIHNVPHDGNTPKKRLDIEVRGKGQEEEQKTERAEDSAEERKDMFERLMFLIDSTTHQRNKLDPKKGILKRVKETRKNVPDGGIVFDSGASSHNHSAPEPLLIMECSAQDAPSSPESVSSHPTSPIEHSASRTSSILEHSLSVPSLILECSGQDPPSPEHTEPSNQTREKSSSPECLTQNPIIKTLLSHTLTPQTPYSKNSAQNRSSNPQYHTRGASSSPECLTQGSTSKLPARMPSINIHHLLKDSSSNVQNFALGLSSDLKSTRKKKIPYKNLYRPDKKNSKVFHCKLCGRVVRNKLEHYLMHNPNSTRCKYCGIKCRSPARLMTHIHSVHKK